MGHYKVKMAPILSYKICRCQVFPVNFLLYAYYFLLLRILLDQRIILYMGSAKRTA